MNDRASRAIRGADLYCLTSFEHSRGRSNLEIVAAMLAAGVRLVQYREKDAKAGHMLEECRAIREMTRPGPDRAGATFIVNDFVDIALLVDADGVHVGQEDLPVPEVRKLLGPDKIIGVSTHSPEQAVQAVRDGADYIGVGPIYATKTKRDVCDPVGCEYLDWVVHNLTIPFVAIGGIKQATIADVTRRGADTAALVTEIVGAEDVGAMVRELRREMERGRGMRG